MAGLVSKLEGATATVHGGSIKRILRDSLYEDFYAGWVLGTSYPSRLPSDAGGLPELGDFAFKGRNLVSFDAEAGATYAPLGSNRYYQAPFSSAALQAAAGSNGISIVGVANFTGATGNKALFGNYNGSTVDGFVFGRASGGQYQAHVAHAGGAGADICAINGDSYTGTGPEFLGFTASAVSSVLYRKKPAAAMQSNTHSLSAAPGGANLCNIGKGLGLTWNGDLNIYSVLVFKGLLTPTRIGYAQEDLQTFHGGHGVMI